jgi:proteasome assembly chaperone (PAC2) family protein
MDSVTWHERPSLGDAVAIVAFEGWNDGGESATAALDHLIEAFGVMPVATLDHEHYADFQVTRPSIVIDATGSRHVDWPTTEFVLARADGRDVVVVRGDEPRLRWRAFCDEVGESLVALGVGRAVLLGAFVGQVPHTAPVPVIGLGPDEVLQGHDLMPSNYQGPTGIVGVLSATLPEYGIETISLWAAVPHYLAGGENPKAAQALLRKAGAVLDLDLRPTDLGGQVARWMVEVGEVMEENEELRGYVETLEASTPPTTGPVADSLVEEIERFLREGE